MKKNYVLDTNVLIQDPTAFFRFQDNYVYIPIYVLEEIDGLKNDPAERGRQAREVARALDELRISGTLDKGVRLENGGTLYIYTPEFTEKLPVATEDKRDHLILQSAISIKKVSAEHRTILVTMDINMRVRAEAMGMQVAAYEFQSVDVSDFGNKVIVHDTAPDVFSDIQQGKASDAGDFEINTCMKVTCNTNEKQTALCRVKNINNKASIVKIDIKRNVMGIAPKNMEQNFALDILLDDEIKLVTIMGTSGVGKTLLALAAGLQSVIDGKYNKLLIARPIMPLGKDIGFLPGDLKEKLQPYMMPFYDNLDYLAMSGGLKKQHNMTIESLFEEGKIEIEPITYIRGRSIPNQFIIVDEVQNLNQHEVKTIVSRCGEGTKIVLTGDPDQIDNPYLDKKNNALSICVKKIRSNPIAAHISLEKGQRSALANLAVESL